MRGEPIRFFRAFGKTFAVTDYEELSEQTPGTSLIYFLKIMLIATILLFLFSIPVFMKFSHNADSALSKFDYLKIDLNYSQREPIVFFEGDNQKQVTIDLNSNATTVEQGKFLITNSSIIKAGLLGSQVTDITGYSNILEHQDKYTNVLNVVLVFLIPSLFVLAYVFFSIKFIIMLLVLSFVAFVVSRIIRFELGYVQCLNTAIYSFTIAILFAMAVFPYNLHYYFFRLEWIGYAVSLVIFIIGLGSVGYFETAPERVRERTKRKKYIELR